MVKYIKITNDRGDVFEFGHHYRLISDLDTSGLDAVVNTSETTGDGSLYRSTKLEERNFEIEFRIDKINDDAIWLQQQRNKMFKVINPLHNPMRIDFTTDSGDKYFMTAQALSTPVLPKGLENNNKAFQKGLIQFLATDPYIYDVAEQNVDIALWMPLFSFPLEIPDEGIEIGQRSKSLIVNVENKGHVETGMMIRFSAVATVKNPKLINLNNYEELKLNVTMQGGDIIEVSTYRGKRSITLIRNVERTNIFNVLDLASKFIQLDVGDNLIRYDAEDDTIDNLVVNMSFRQRWVGV